MHAHIWLFTWKKICLYILKEFFEYIERERTKDFEILARKYRAIGPLLTKMEGLVVHTNTGKSPKLHQYYSFWEKKVHESLTRVRYYIFSIINLYSDGRQCTKSLTWVRYCIFLVIKKMNSWDKRHVSLT